MIDELTGLPTTRTGVVPRREGELGPGAEGGTVCVVIADVACDCTGAWEVWQDCGLGTLVFRHTGADGKVYRHAFDAFRFPLMPAILLNVTWLTKHEVHPVNAPTPGRRGR